MESLGSAGIDERVCGGIAMEEEERVRRSQHPALNSALIKASLINRVTKYGRESPASKYLLAGLCVYYSVFFSET